MNYMIHSEFARITKKEAFMKNTISELKWLYLSFPFLLYLTKNFITYNNGNGTIIPVSSIILIITYLISGIILFKKLNRNASI